MIHPTVLVAVTDLFFLAKIRTALEAQGCIVRVATEAKQIINESISNKPAIVILDLGLSSINPIVFIKELREIPDLKKIPVLGYTNHLQVPDWEDRLKDDKTKVVPNSYISSNINRIVELIELFY